MNSASKMKSAPQNEHDNKMKIVKHDYCIPFLLLNKWDRVKMNSAPQKEQKPLYYTIGSPKRKVLPKTNGAPQYEHLKKKNLKKMAVFATETLTKLAKKIVIR